MGTTEQKDSLRRRTIEARSQLSAQQLARWDAGLTAACLTALEGFGGTIALYASRPAEPDTAALISELAGRVRVLLPALRATPNWAEFAGWGAMRSGWAGIPEPTAPPLGADALGEADVIVCPALLADLQGNRLGTGGGWYDRALGARGQQAQLWCLVHPTEVGDHLPIERHDVPMDAIITADGFRPTNQQLERFQG